MLVCLCVSDVDVLWLNSYTYELIFSVKVTTENSCFVLDGRTGSTHGLGRPVFFVEKACVHRTGKKSPSSR